MGGKHSQEFEGIHFKRKFVQGLVSINFEDDFIYPKMPKDEDIKKKLTKLFEEIDITSKQKKELESLPFPIKWKLICKHQDYLT